MEIQSENSLKRANGVAVASCNCLGSFLCSIVVGIRACIIFPRAIFASSKVFSNLVAWGWEPSSGASNRRHSKMVTFILPDSKETFEDLGNKKSF